MEREPQDSSSADGIPSRKRRVVPWLLGGAIAVGAAVVGWGLLRNPGDRHDASPMVSRTPTSAVEVTSAPADRSGPAASEQWDSLPGLEDAASGDGDAAGGHESSDDGAGQGSEAFDEGADRSPSLWEEELPETTGALFDELRGVVDALVKDFPHNPDAWEMQARAHFWIGDSVAATAAWRKCLELTPQYVYAYQGLARVALKKGEYDEAIDLLQKALAAVPAAPQTEIDLATALVDAGRAPEAIALLDTHVKKNPQSTAAFVLLGMACLESQDWERARQAYETAIRLHPQHANAHYGLATACSRLGLNDQARESMTRFNQLRAEERQIRKDERAAYDDIQVMRALAGELYTDAARLYYARRDTADAERLLRRAARLAPSAAECRQALAWICRESNRLPEAIALLGQLAAADSGNAKYPLEIGRLYQTLGDTEAAASAFRQALAIDPDNAECRQALDSLREER